MVIWFNLVLKVLFTVTVKVVIFVCPLFHQFHDPNKTAKLKGIDADTIPTLIDFQLAHH